MANYTNSVLYIGVTNDLVRRTAEHKSHVIDGFTSRYNCKKLVYYEECFSIKEAFLREKQVQGWSRKKREALINGWHEKLPELSRKKVVSTSSTTADKQIATDKLDP